MGCRAGTLLHTAFPGTTKKAQCKGLWLNEGVSAYSETEQRVEQGGEEKMTATSWTGTEQVKSRGQIAQKGSDFPGFPAVKINRH